MPLVLVDAVVATEAVYTGVDASAVEVPPPAVAAATAADVYVTGRGETVVRRSVAATTATVPVQAVAEAITTTVAGSTGVVKTTQVISHAVENLDAATSLNLEPLVAIVVEIMARLGESFMSTKIVVEDLSPDWCVLLAVILLSLLFAGIDFEVFMPLVLVDAVVATEAVYTGVDASAVEVPPPAVAAATAADVYVTGRGETVVRRSVAATTATVPVQAVAEA